MDIGGGGNQPGIAISVIIVLLLVPALSVGGDAAMKVYTTLPSSPEGLCLDSKANLYAAEPGISQIIVLPPNTIGWNAMTPRKVLGLGAPLQGPTSIFIRDGVLYTANLSFGYPEDQKNKAVVAIENFSRD
jgi:hypothetical protein